jgi:hypothetical protein
MGPKTREQTRISTFSIPNCAEQRIHTLAASPVKEAASVSRRSTASRLHRNTNLAMKTAHTTA